ncbi:DUF1284 domain-containing protein [Chloroflexota bacterium]
MYLRPHHFYCAQFTIFTNPERGHRFQVALENRKKLLEDITTNIDIGRGPDFICAVCPFFSGHECIHPKGDEKAVRKWDAKIINELSLEEGQRLNVSQLNKLIEKSSPLSFCITKCPYYRNNHCNPLKTHESLD